MLKGLARGSAVARNSRIAFRNYAAQAAAAPEAAEVEAVGENGIKQSILDCLTPRVKQYVLKGDQKLVERLNATYPYYAFKLNTASEEQLKQMQATNLYETIANCKVPWDKEWESNGSDSAKWLTSLKTCVGSVETAIYCWRAMRIAGVYPGVEHYKAMMDIEAYAGHYDAAGYTLGELSERHQFAKPDAECYSILLRMGLDLKDWRIAYTQIKIMEKERYPVPAELKARFEDLQKVWDHDAYINWAFKDGAKPQFIVESEEEILKRLKASMCFMPYSVESRQQRYDRLKSLNILPEEVLKNIVPEGAQA